MKATCNLQQQLLRGGANNCKLHKSAAANRAAFRPFRAPVRSTVRTPAAAAAMDAQAVAQHLARLPFPPHMPLAGAEKGSFAEGTIAKRLPAILENTVKDMLAEAAGASPEVAAQIKIAAEGVRALRSEMLANATLPPVSCPGSEADPAFQYMLDITNASLDAWKAHSGHSTWFELPWLLIECYMYVRIAAAIRAQPAAAAVDPFRVQKLAAFTKSAAQVADIAATALPLCEGAAGSDEKTVRQHLFQLVQYSLWGNKTDLSMLVDASNIGAAQAAAAAPTDGSAHPYVIVDEFEPLWARLRGLRQQGAGSPRRIDIVLDNAGLELYGDLVLADYLLAAGMADVIVFHGKAVPWFVSDTLRADFYGTIDLCAGNGDGAAGWSAVQSMAKRWAAYVKSDKWIYQDDAFWTTPLPFCHMEATAPVLHAELKNNSALLIFKGDLNYRKLAYDCRWPAATPFAQALMGFRPAPLLSLRTLKADVVAGLQRGQAEVLTSQCAEWMVNGKYGMVQYCE